MKKIIFLGIIFFEIILPYNASAFDGSDSSSVEIEYWKSNGIIALICEKKCPISREILDAKFDGLIQASEAIQDLFKAKFAKKVKPIRIHLNVDSSCSKDFLDTMGTAHAGIANIKKGGSDICLYEYENTLNQNISVPLTLENAGKLKQQLLAIHEMTHMLFYEKTDAIVQAHKKGKAKKRISAPYYFEEPIVKMASFLLVGGEEKHYLDSLCDGDGKNKNYSFFTEMCKKYGLDFKHFPALYKMMNTKEPWFQKLKQQKITSKDPIGDTNSYDKNTAIMAQKFFEQLLGVTVPLDMMEIYLRW